MERKILPGQKNPPHFAYFSSLISCLPVHLIALKKLKPRSQFRRGGGVNVDKKMLVLKDGRTVPVPELKPRQVQFGLQEHKKYSTELLGKCTLLVKGSILDDLIQDDAHTQYRWFTLDNSNESVGIRFDRTLSRQEQTKPLDSIYHDYKLRTKWQLLVKLSLTSSECAPLPLVQGLKDFDATSGSEAQGLAMKSGENRDDQLEKRRLLQNSDTNTVEARMKKVKREGWGPMKVLGGDDNDGPDELEKIGQELADKIQANAFVPGGHQIGIHIIEVRDLKAKNASRTADPIVMIEVLGVKHFSKVKTSCTSAIFDERFYFEFPHLEREDFETGVLKISVCNAGSATTLLAQNGLGKLAKRANRAGGAHNVIGTYSFDLRFLYFREQHEVYRQWVAVSDEMDVTSQNAISGYLRVSANILGPGDKLPVHNEAKDHEKELKDELLHGLTGFVLMPPRTKQTLSFLVVTIHGVQDLPAVNPTLTKEGFQRQNVDACFQVDFAGNPNVKTRSIFLKGMQHLGTDRLNEEIWLPVFLPSMSDVIRVSVWDETIANYSLLGYLQNFSFTEVQKSTNTKGRVGVGRPQWYNMYGYSVQGQSLWASLKGASIHRNVVRKMNEIPDLGTAYTGSVLLSMRVESGEHVFEEAATRARVHIRQKSGMLDPSEKPKTRKFLLRGFIVAGSELPTIQSKVHILRNSKLSCQLSIGKFTLQTHRRKNENGRVRWMELLECEVELPEDVNSMPDLFVNIICSKATDDSSQKTNVCGTRLKAKQVMEEGISADMKWIKLKEDPIVLHMNSALFGKKMTPGREHKQGGGGGGGGGGG
jgi:hypothetical protein